MDTVHSKSAFVYREVRQALQSGRYAPGQRLDLARLAEKLHISITPIRFALYHLVGETLIVDHGRNGLRVPLPTEATLRDLYGWMEHLLLTACDIGVASTTRKTKPLKLSPAEDDLVKLTWQLFDMIARMTVHEPLHHAVKQANDRLAPIRWLEQDLLEHPFEELSELNRHWQERDTPALKSALRDYHEHRKQLVPRIAILLDDRGD